MKSSTGRWVIGDDCRPLRAGLDSGNWRRNGEDLKLTMSYGLSADDGVARSVYQHLGIGIPQHVQSFFACLWDYVQTHDRNLVGNRVIGFRKNDAP